MLIDLAGRRFGRFLVLRRLPNKGRTPMWECLCDCGEILCISGERLRSGVTRSCGCLRRERCREKRLDLTGRVFGRWTVLKLACVKRRRCFWLCVCDCGKYRIVQSSNLLCGKSTSCGCLRAELVHIWPVKHGHARAHRHSREYQSWASAKARCYNPNNADFRLYGGRGIRMCEEWRNDFAAFFAVMGRCLEGCTIDRIDVNGNYEPGNCRWATTEQQSRNKRNNRYYEHAGEKLIAADWAKRLGISRPQLLSRLQQGYTLADLFAPAELPLAA